MLAEHNNNNQVGQTHNNINNNTNRWVDLNTSKNMNIENIGWTHQQPTDGLNTQQHQQQTSGWNTQKQQQQKSKHQQQTGVGWTHSNNINNNAKGE